MHSVDALHRLIESMLRDTDLFLGGLDVPTPNQADFIAAMSSWADRSQATLGELLRSIEPSIRQQILFALLPARAFESGYSGSYDAAIKAHAAALGVSLSEDSIDVLRAVIINLQKLAGLNARTARTRSFGMAQVRGHPKVYERIMRRQGRRCHWCGTPLEVAGMEMSLDHITPKHVGNDPLDGSNWAFTCRPCNSGKSASLTWSTASGTHNYLHRNDVLEPHILSCEHRWVVLARDRACGICQSKTAVTELFVARRIPTGLPIPSNCYSVCEPCAAETDAELLQWAAAGDTGSQGIRPA